MEQQSCVYCGRMLDLSELIAKDKKYRCRDENDCLDYQTRDDSSGSLEDIDYASLVDAFLRDAEQRLAGYRKAEGERTGAAATDTAEVREAFAWMKAGLDALAAKYAGNQKFTFAYDETTQSRYQIVFDDGKELRFTVDLANPTGSRYWLHVTRGPVAGSRLEDAFLYKSYPDDRREDVMGDLVTILLAFESEPAAVDALLNGIRKDLESRCDHR